MYKGLIGLGFKDTDFKLQNDGNGTYIKEWYSNNPMPTIDAILLKESEIEKLELVESLKKRTMDMADEKSEAAKSYINGNILTPQQLERYETKVQIARDHLAGTAIATDLQLEADVQGITLDELCTLIISMSDQYNASYKTYCSLIEAARIYINKIIDTGDYVRADELLNIADSFNETTTEADIRALMI